MQTKSKLASRIEGMWQAMRQPVMDNFPAPKGSVQEPGPCLEAVELAYPSDAYHSLSLEGYRVTPELIEQAKSDHWSPAPSKAGEPDHNALAARGYWLAFQAVKADIGKALAGGNPGEVVQRGHRDWYWQLFSPGLATGTMKPEGLVGYRNSNVYIRRSRHVPPGSHAVLDAICTFFDLLASEDSPAARAVLGHFVFVFIHPYMDGNGRLGRLLMNAMLVAGGYPWTIVPVQRRQEYLRALEEASVNSQILPFTRLLASLLP